MEKEEEKEDEAPKKEERSAYAVVEGGRALVDLARSLATLRGRSATRELDRRGSTRELASVPRYRGSYRLSRDGNYESRAATIGFRRCGCRRRRRWHVPTCVVPPKRDYPPLRTRYVPRLWR